ncbi:DUF1127 domain-containing protein [Yoonia sp. R2331]|uniref:DUF1127 domain-containing protein n=1 Tax=Yoonia sp. R2331 TaxID=3237238 RepID=UPI0034E40188
MSHVVHAAFHDATPNHQTLPTLARVLIALAVVVTAWDTRSRSRRALSRLEAHELDDIGVSAPDAQREADKPFWQG